MTRVVSTAQIADQGKHTILPGCTELPDGGSLHAIECPSHREEECGTCREVETALQSSAMPAMALEAVWP